MALPGYYASLTHYVPQSVLEHEINKQFFAKHGKHSSLSLTKIRSIKATMVRIALESGLELCSVAMAFVYFEKLILSRVIDRESCGAAAGACLLLAVKAHDLKSIDYAVLIYNLSQAFGKTANAILRSEFPVFAALHFDLYLDQDDYVPHLERIFIDLPYSNLQEYLGERMYQLWRQNK